MLFQKNTVLLRRKLSKFRYIIAKIALAKLGHDHAFTGLVHSWTKIILDYIDKIVPCVLKNLCTRIWSFPVPAFSVAKCIFQFLSPPCMFCRSNVFEEVFPSSAGVPRRGMNLQNTHDRPKKQKNSLSARKHKDYISENAKYFWQNVLL